VGTLGSWGFYGLGIFMACVFMVGPKTSFGKSEQNSVFWLQLLMAAKQNPTLTWYDEIDDETKTLHLKRRDWQQWIRFFMSFLINGVGFHILIHALPIQVAAESSLTGVVFRALGMIYLVDLDDSLGYTMTVVPPAGSNNESDAMMTKLSSVDDVMSKLRQVYGETTDDSSAGSASCYQFFSGDPANSQRVITKGNSQKTRKTGRSTRHQPVAEF